MIMRRREFIATLGGIAMWPIAARAQQPAMPVIGFLSGRFPDESASLVAAFHRGLAENGYVERRNVTIEYRWAHGQYDRLPALAAELVRRPVAVLVTAGGEPAALAAKAATSSIAIVFTVGGDPVKLGLVASYNRPGGNATGTSIVSPGLEAKRLGLLHELVPKAATVGVLVNPTYPPAVRQLSDVEEAGRLIGVQIHVLRASNDREIEAAFETVGQQRIDALLQVTDPFFTSRREQLVALAIRYALPVIYPFGEFATAGGLMSYGIDLPDVYRQLGTYSGRILKGAKPADLPVVQPTRFKKLIAAIGSAAATLPLAARAQQPIPVIGFLNNASPQGYAPMVAAFRRGLKEAGYVEDRNVAVEYRWADNQYARLPALADELVRRQVRVIVANGPAATAAKTATTSIPIVFTIAGDPVQLGLVASVNRPGGNVTGVTNLNLEVAPKRLELLRELVPTATIFALLVNPTNPNSENLSRELEAAARTFGLQTHIVRASAERDFDKVFATLVRLRAGGLVISPDTLFVSRSEQLAALTVRHRVPAVHSFPPFARAGGLMSYAINLADAYRIVGGYVGRILDGEKPDNLPVQQVTTVELIINFKTAKVLGLSVPPSLLARADEVIE